MPEFGSLCYPDFVVATTKTGGLAPEHESVPDTVPVGAHEAAYVGTEPAPPPPPAAPAAPGSDGGGSK